LGAHAGIVVCAADGSHLYNVPSEQTAEARRVMGPGKLLCPEVWVLLETDPSKARAAGRQALALTCAWTIRSNWRRLGGGDNELARYGSDRMVDATVAWGDEAAIRARIQEHWDAGAAHVYIQTIRSDGARLPDERLLALLAPGTGG
jgi:probable F420-dependent oxidoreductase